MTEKGIPIECKLTNLLVRILFLLVTCLSQHASASTSDLDKTIQKKYVHIIYTQGNTLHDNIFRKLSAHLYEKHSDITVNTVKPDATINSVDDKNDLIIGIGAEGIQSANEHYPEASKLFISTDPNMFRLDEKDNKHDAILYMTQSYCRQIRFIKLLNARWNTISILNSEGKPVDSTSIRQCANKHGIKIYTVRINSNESTTEKLKHALQHSDVLLALPDSNIYNSRSVKNILLTSYRYRRPVIAFSNNFANAGALASIYSSTGQIAQSASKLIEQHYDSGTWLKQVNHPDEFDIEINRQVFKALDITTPDKGKLKESLKKLELDNPDIPQ